MIVEATLPNMKPDLSQGSHFFHNLIAFGVFYFSIRGAEEKTIDWKWLNEQEIVSETEYIRHIRTERALDIRVAAKRKRGVILK